MTTPAAAPAASPGSTGPASTELLTQSWDLDPGVAVRPEPFGALLYHFGTRRLSFVRSREVVAVLHSLAGAPSVQAACDAAGVTPQRLATTVRALQTLAASGLIQRRHQPETAGSTERPTP